MLYILTKYICDMLSKYKGVTMIRQNGCIPQSTKR